MDEIRTIGIDLGKNVFHLACMDEACEVVKRRKCTRPQLFAFFRNLLPQVLTLSSCLRHSSEHSHLPEVHGRRRTGSTPNSSRAWKLWLQGLYFCDRYQGSA
mgnify:CR=1 FL=1